jgi:hypothetical protein
METQQVNSILKQLSALKLDCLVLAELRQTVGPA